MNLTDITPERLEQAREFIRTFLQTEFPNMDLSDGRVLYELLLTPSAYVTALNDQQMDNLRRNMSLQEIVDNPSIAEPESVDRILSNFNITRKEGAKAAGSVTIVLTNNASTVVAAGAVFTYNGLNFITANTYIGTTNSTDFEYARPIRTLSSGSYAFTIPVEAELVGSAYSVKKNTTLAWSSPSSNYVTSYAEADFTGGTDDETNEELLNRMQNGISAKIMSGRANIEALIKEEFPNTASVSIIGFGDQEMIRDRHNIFSLSTGGKADIYVKTADYPVVDVVTKDCMLISTNPITFQVLITKEDYPGFYSIESIIPADAENVVGGLEIVSETRSMSYTDISYNYPDIDTLVEGAYSRYQIVSVQFYDPDADITGMTVGTSTKEYKFTLSGMPSVAPMQDFVSDRSRRNPQADYLVRAAIPMRVTLTVNIDKYLGGLLTDTSAIKSAAAKAVNDIGFSLGRVPASLIIDAIQEVLPSKLVLRVPIFMTGVIRNPSGTLTKLYSTDELVIEDNLTECVSNRTVIPYLDPEDVAVTIATVSMRV